MVVYFVSNFKDFFCGQLKSLLPSIKSYMDILFTILIFEGPRNQWLALNCIFYLCANINSFRLLKQNRSSRRMVSSTLLVRRRVCRSGVVICSILIINCTTSCDFALLFQVRISTSFSSSCIDSFRDYSSSKRWAFFLSFSITVHCSYKL